MEVGNSMPKNCKIWLVSKKYNLPLIPFLLEGVALNPDLNQNDGIHPNKEGTIVISQTLEKTLNTVQDILN